MKNYLLFFSFLFLFTSPNLIGQKTELKNQSKELGQVHWYRNYDKAIEASLKSNKPIFILFQEVPGCSTCQRYGNEVLGHPLIVDAIENEFIPLAIFNNKGGHDRKILEKFKEPTWNNPVVRIIKPDGTNIIERLNSNYSKKGIINYMTFGLSAGFYGVPDYLKLLNEEFSENTKEATYSMYCFWSGEAHLGQLHGVIKTESGFMNGKEVVKVSYDPSIIEKKTITKHAEKASCKLESSTSTFRKDKDPQYYLKKSVYNYLPLSNLQKTKINTAIKSKENPSRYLSPSQINYLNLIESEKVNPHQNLYDMNLLEAWKYINSNKV